jgi:hypothetical protein
LPGRANAGLSVLLNDRDAAVIDCGMTTIRKNYQISVARPLRRNS